MVPQVITNGFLPAVEANKAGREAAEKEDRARRQQEEGERRKRDEAADRKAQADAAVSLTNRRTLYNHSSLF